MTEVLVGAVFSVITGVGLWAVLPRGVVLTRTVRTQDALGQLMRDTWEIRNDSALPVRITSAIVVGAQTFDPETERINEIELPVFEGEGTLGVTLTFDDEVLEIRRTGTEQLWNQQVIPPGDTLQAVVGINTSLRIEYRRAGRFGHFERRELEIHGYV